MNKIKGELYFRSKKQQIFRLRRAKKGNLSKLSYTTLFSGKKIAPEGGEIFWDQKILGIEKCLKIMVGISKSSLKTKSEPSLIQRNDITTQRGTFAKIQKHTGWNPEINIQSSLRDLLEYWHNYYLIMPKAGQKGGVTLV